VNNQSLKVFNQLASDCEIRGTFEKLDQDLIYRIKSNQIFPKPLLICSGGTSSRCAANDHWSLDLRKNYQKITFNKDSKEIEIEAGVIMRKVLNELSLYKRSFPIGLSNKTGIGYILTGGISPISRSQGLAIDQIQKIKGIWGSGEVLELSKPNESSSIHEKTQWRALKGAAPFLSIITSITLKTHQEKPLYLCSDFVNVDQLSELISKAEQWPKEASLQWIWGETIKAYVVIRLEKSKDRQLAHKIIKELPFGENCQISLLKGLKDFPNFSLPMHEEITFQKTHAEVISLLGENWGLEAKAIIKDLNLLITKRPNKYCYVASQQLGGVTTLEDQSASSFIYRNSVWKPWINASWPAGDMKTRAQSLSWMEEVWKLLKTTCPGVHLAQIHSHLSWHKKELEMAFLDWLPELRNLKSIYDPEGLLPPL
tara:strand:- start:19198 stop:20478 length:1281 start_codon:yes stop_codon:yes gene_type:complete